MLIRNIWTFEDNKRVLKNILIKKGIIKSLSITERLSAKPDKIWDAESHHTYLPGLFDVHVHGYGGCDFAEVGENPNYLPVILSALGETGLSYVLATLISLDLNTLKKTLHQINRYVLHQEKNLQAGMTKILGVHLEGPFITKKYKGSHSEKNLQTQISVELFQEIISFAPNIKHWKITLSPELYGAQEFIHASQELVKDNLHVKISLGHGNPQDENLIADAIAAGAIGFTHLGNACGESCARSSEELDKTQMKSQLVQWVLANPKKCPPGVEMILDGVHLSKSFFRLVKKILGEKLILVSDALGPAGCGDGFFNFGSTYIRNQHNCFYVADKLGNFLLQEKKNADGNVCHEKILAGSATNLVDCMQQFIAWCPEESSEKNFQSLYAAMITNPRKSSLSHEIIQQLPDDQNGVIINDRAELKYSVCNGLLREHF